jgi:hypothetical protein
VPLIKPVIGGDYDGWGQKLNDALDYLNTLTLGRLSRSSNLADVNDPAAALANLGGLSETDASATYALLKKFVVTPEQYGAAGDNVTDDTAAFRSAVNAVAANGFGIVLLDQRKTYRCSGAPDTSKGGNAVIPLPNTGSGTIAIVGGGETYGDRGAQITAPQTGLTYSAVNGCPSVIGGPTPEGSGSTFNGWNIVIDGLTIAVPANPTISGIDLAMCQRGRVTRTKVSSASVASAATSIFQFGYRHPLKLNYNDCITDDFQAVGCYVGTVVSAHSDIRQLGTKWCVLGVGIQDPAETGSVDPHSINIGYWGSEHCNYHLGGWKASAGAQSNAGGGHGIVINLWDIEDAPSGWQTTTQHVLDANSKISGKANYQRTLGGTGASLVPLLVSGGGLLALTDIGARPPSLGLTYNATVAAQESTTSASFTDLTTPGPAVTVPVGGSGKVLLIMQAEMQSGTNNTYAMMAYAVSGATTVAAVEIARLRGNSAINEQTVMASAVVTGLTPGNNTFTAKYGAPLGGTQTFANRRILAIPL